jgi:hypothetical protein
MLIETIIAVTAAVVNSVSAMAMGGWITSA